MVLETLDERPLCWEVPGGAWLRPWQSVSLNSLECWSLSLPVSTPSPGCPLEILEINLKKGGPAQGQSCLLCVQWGCFEGVPFRSQGWARFVEEPVIPVRGTNPRCGVCRISLPFLMSFFGFRMLFSCVARRWENSVGQSCSVRIGGPENEVVVCLCLCLPLFLSWVVYVLDVCVCVCLCALFRSR